MFKGYIFFFNHEDVEQKLTQFIESSEGAIQVVSVQTPCNKIFEQGIHAYNQHLNAMQEECNKKINDIKLQTLQAKMALLTAQKKIKAAQSMINDYKSQINILKHQIECRSVILEQIEEEEKVKVVSGVEILFRDDIEPWQRIVIQDLIKHVTLGSCEYADETLELARIIHTYSPAALEAARKYIPLPCARTLANHFHEQEEMMEGALLNDAYAPDILDYMDYPVAPNPDFPIQIDPMGNPVFNQYYHERLGRIHEILQETRSEPRISIALDAIALKLWSTVSDKEGDFNDLFIFYAMPLNFEARNVAIHCIPHSNGSAGKTIIEKLDELIKKVQKVIHVSYVVTDGDPGYYDLQDAFFNFWFDPKMSLEEMKEKAKEYITDYNVVFIRDIVHLAKNFRAWLINPLKTISTSPIDKCQTVDPSDIEDLIKLGDALNDISNIGKMKDRYAITLFSMQVLQKCMQAKKFAPFLFIFPLAFLFEAIRNEHFDQETRVQMLEIALDAVIALLKNIVTFDLGKTLPRDEEDPDIVYYFATPRHLQALASAIMVFIIELEVNPKLNFSHLTTLSEEHFNGLIRTMGRYKFDYISTMRVISKVNCLMAIENDRKFPKHPERRGDSAGTTMDPEKHLEKIILDFDRASIVNCILSLCKNPPLSHDASNDEQGWLIFCRYFDKLFKLATPIKISKALSSQLQGNLIMARLAQKKPNDAYTEDNAHENAVNEQNKSLDTASDGRFHLTPEQLNGILQDHVVNYMRNQSNTK